MKSLSRVSECVVLTSHSTHNRSFQRQVFPGNQLHWYWQPNTIKHNTAYTRNTKEKLKLDSLRWFSRRSQMQVLCTRCDVSSDRIALFRFCVMRHDSANTTFWGLRSPVGAMTPNSNSAKIFVQCTYPQVCSSCVYLFGSYRVDKHTHKQTDAAENI